MQVEVEGRAQIWSAAGRFSLAINSIKPVGEGVSERRIDYGPGYRLYFGKDGDLLVLLLNGGTKKRQQKDIEDAKRYWKDYKRRKKKGE